MTSVSVSYFFPRNRHYDCNFQMYGTSTILHFTMHALVVTKVWCSTWWRRPTVTSVSVFKPLYSCIDSLKDL